VNYKTGKANFFYHPPILLIFIQDTKTKKDRKTERQKDRKTKGQKDRRTERQKDRKTKGQKDRKTKRQKDRKTEGQKDKRTKRQKDRQRKKFNKGWQKGGGQRTEKRSKKCRKANLICKVFSQLFVRILGPIAHFAGFDLTQMPIFTSVSRVSNVSEHKSTVENAQ